MQIDEKYFEQSNTENTLESVLGADEKILFRSKPNKRSYILAAVLKMLPIAVVWLCFDSAFLALIGVGIRGGEVPVKLLGFIVPFFVIHLTPVWIWLSKIVKSAVEIKNIEYAFTDKRIIVRSGVIGIDFKFFYYDKIESVVAKVGLVDKICKVGDIYITAAGTAGVIFDQQDPYGLATKLQKIANDARADLYYPNALRPTDDPPHGEDAPAPQIDPLLEQPAWENAPLPPTSDEKK